MSILAIFTNFLDFYYFREATATVLLGVSKIPTVNFEIHSFSCYLFKIFVFQLHKSVPWEFGVRVKTERFFSCVTY